jgi:allantoin racemase
LGYTITIRISLNTTTGVFKIERIVRIIHPVATDRWNEQSRVDVSTVIESDTKLEIVNLTTGPISIESGYEATLVAPKVVEEVKKAETEGASGAVVACFYDPGVVAAREVVTMPVIGIMEAGLTVAAVTALRYGILTTTSADYSSTWKMAFSMYPGRLVSYQDIDTPVLELADTKRFFRNAREKAKRMVFRDRADAIVLGCSGLLGLDVKLQQEVGVPVIAPLKAAVKLIELFSALGISHSKRSYPAPNYNILVGE